MLMNASQLSQLLMNFIHQRQRCDERTRDSRDLSEQDQGEQNTECTVCHGSIKGSLGGAVRH